MSLSWWSRLGLFVFFVILAGLFLYPTLKGLDRDDEFFIKKRLSLGLDLQGGLHMTLGIDFKRAFEDQLRANVNRFIAQAKKDGAEDASFGGIIEGRPELDPAIRINFPKGSRDSVHATYKRYSNYELRLIEDEDDHFSVGLTKAYRENTHSEAVSRSIQVIRNRIDEFGVTEPVITSQGEDRVVVQLPGVADVERAKSLIGKTAKLEFRIVNTEKSFAEIAQIVKDIEQEKNIEFKSGETKFSDYVRQINDNAKGKIPESTLIAFSKEKNRENGEFFYTPYLLEQEVKVSGDDLQDASVSVDQQSNMPIVLFSLKPSGAKRMGELTGENLKKQMAVVLDSVVHSAPVIQGKITDSGQITLGVGNYEDNLRDAKDTAVVLRAGALPVQLEFQEQRVVGPSLGHDSIESATKASMVGAILVVVFMLLYYRVSGMFAIITLVSNVTFLLALLVSFDATLTLPGIAGIALTIGMAVDGNIIIFERIREEVGKGKSAMPSIEAGFQKAFSTIIDANITTAIAGFFLLQFGTGPIRGFAVTLLVGIVTTIYTSYYVSKIFFDIYLRNLEEKNKQVSI